jgi:hypothetical protein
MELGGKDPLGPDQLGRRGDQRRVPGDPDMELGGK